MGSGLDYWRRFFAGCGADIFGVIENAIMVAALDCPGEFLSRRDGIAERLFSCRRARCVGCDRVELRVPCGEGEELTGRGRDGCGEDGGGGHEGDRIVSNYSYDEAEALTEEIEEEGQAAGEVLRIKELLACKEYESESVVFESLRRLQLMGISVETLKATEIGKIVNGLKKHSSKQIRQLARTLIEGWKTMVEEWANSTAVLAEATPESAKPSLAFDQWEGLPLPPLDEGALLATTQTGAMELSQFFDGMDDDGNFRGSGANDIAEKARVLNDDDIHLRRQPKPAARVLEGGHRVTKFEDPNMLTNQPKPVNKQRIQHGDLPDIVPRNQPQQLNRDRLDSGAATVRPPRPSSDQTSAQIQKRPMTAANVKERPEDNSVREKLEVAKRKLHEGYRQAETAKRQRTIQVMELHDLPKQALDSRQLQQRAINCRYWANRRT